MRRTFMIVAVALVAAVVVIGVEGERTTRPPPGVPPWPFQMKRPVAADDAGPRLRGLGVGDVLTVAEAVRALALRERDGMTWLRDCGLIRTVAGRERVVWSEVLENIRTGGKTIEEPHVSARPSSRTPLRRGVIDAPSKSSPASRPNR